MLKTEDMLMLFSPNEQNERSHCQLPQPKKVIKQLTSIEYSLVFSRPHDGQVHVLSLESVLEVIHDIKPAGLVQFQGSV